MADTRDLFDPAGYQGVRLPLLEAESLPRGCYDAQAFYEREVERIFLKTWLFVGRADEVARQGDFFTVETGGGPVIIIRGRGGDVRAFANTCRHRGARLLNGNGNCQRAIACPYHGWTYGLDGSLLGAPAMERTANFEKSKYGLWAVRVAVWDGFVFINFDSDCEPLEDYLGDLPQRLATYGFGDMVCVRRRQYDIACNWKLFVENSVEDYHTATVHKGSIGTQAHRLQDTEGNWHAMYWRIGDSIAVLPDQRATLPRIATLTAETAAGTYFAFVYPNTTLCCVQDCMWWIGVHPQGPNRCRVVFGSCFPKSTTEQPAFDQAVETYYHRWDVALAEDCAVAELQQAGLASALRRPGRYSWREPLVHRLANWILDRVLDEPNDAVPARRTVV